MVCEMELHKIAFSIFILLIMLNSFFNFIPEISLFWCMMRTLLWLEFIELQ